jgi:glycine cleavage system pyridoxal-binding protein P
VLRRGRFDDLVRRQLDLFETDAASLLDEADAADAAWTNAAREDTEELFGDYQLVVDQIAEQLLDVRETYAATLDEDTAETYRRAFNRVAVIRFRPYSALLLSEE